MPEGEDAAVLQSGGSETMRRSGTHRRHNRDPRPEGRNTVLPMQEDGAVMPLSSQSAGEESRVDDVSADMIDAQLQRGHRWLHFSAPLEARFEDDTSEPRRRHLSIASLVGVLIYCFLSINDPQILPDDVDLCRQVQFVLTPMMLAAILYARRKGVKPWLREVVIGGSTVLLGWSVIVTIALSRAPTAIPHAAAVVLLPMFAGIAARLRFRYTLAVSVLTMIPLLVMVHGHSPTEELILGDVIAIYISGSAFTLIASYLMEHRGRTAYLLRWLEQLQRYALTQAHEKMRQLSLIDPLTGVANRRQFDREFEKAWMLAADDEVPLAVLILDVDFFKAYNDGYGHLAGDACLQRIATVIADIAQQQQACMARLGGEEFGFLLPWGGLEAAVKIGEMLCTAVRDTAIPHSFSPVQPTVTISIGAAAMVPKAGADGAALLTEADDALYRAKSLGRNRVAVVAGTAPGLCQAAPRLFAAVG